MTTYTAIPNTSIDIDSPVTQPLLTALRDNPIAITEGSSGAPKIKPEALDIYYGDGSASGIATIISVYDLDNVDYALIVGEIDVTGGPSATVTCTIQYRTSTDNGATWSAYTTFASVTAPISTNVIERPTDILDISSANAIQFQQSTSGGNTTIKVAGFGV